MDIDLLSKMVKELILDNERVVLPGLGSFVAEIVPATFSDKGYTINPPYRKLYFRSKPDGDSDLIPFYAKSNSVSEEIAEKVIVDFVSELKAVLFQKKTVIFPGLGRLRATKENAVFFVADEELDIYPAGFGLEPISLKTHQESAEEVTAAVEGLRNILEEQIPAPQQEQQEQLDQQPEPQPEVQPEQQKAQAQVVTDVLNIVSNDQKIETNIVFVDDADEFADFEMVIEDKEEEIVEEEIFFTVEEMPKFRGGGLPEFRNWVQQNVKYPQIALENGIQGNVVIQFVVGPDGKMTNFKVLQSPDKTLADATIEVLKKANEMKNGWKPGKQRGKPVKVSFTLPVAFKIQN